MSAPFSDSVRSFATILTVAVPPTPDVGDHYNSDAGLLAEQFSKTSICCRLQGVATKVNTVTTAEASIAAAFEGFAGTIVVCPPS